MGDDPMLWKELHASGSPAPRWARPTVAILIVLLLGTLLGPSGRAFREWQADSLAVQARQDLNRSLRQFSAGLAVLGLAAVAAVGATSITGERERGTWTWLEMTPITGPEIARAKVAGTLWGLRGLAAPFLVLWTMGLATGSVHPLGGLAAAAGLVVFAWAATALGVLVSSIATTSERALTATFLVLLLGNVLALSFVPLNLVGALAGSRPGLFLAGVSPFMEWIALASPAEIRAARGGWAWDEPLTLPFGLWRTRVLLTPALIPTFAASLALHAAVALGATRAAAGSLARRHRTASRKTAPV